jgi:hypothetical protein
MKVRVNDLFINRLKFIKGCLTAKSMSQLVDQINNLPAVIGQIFLDEKEA